MGVVGYINQVICSILSICIYFPPLSYRLCADFIASECIGLYDPPEKIILRWKGEDPETIGNIVKRTTENASNAAASGKGLNIQLTASGGSSVDRSYKGNLRNTESMSAKTVIQSSDGSARIGRKEGKEHWEHTKKWSQEFLQVYNDETDPEVKSIMKDMGTDLDRKR